MTKFFSSKKYYFNIAAALVMAMFFIGDRILKNIALNIGQGQIYPLLKDWLSFHYVSNPYIAFSIPLSGLLLNTLISSAILFLLCYIIYLIITKKNFIALILPLTFILFGAISNLLDRFLYGFVVDYFDLKYFTIFNIADVMIIIGTIYIILYELSRKPSNQNRN
jgi:signal peptidase II